MKRIQRGVVSIPNRCDPQVEVAIQVLDAL